MQDYSGAPLSGFICGFERIHFRDYLVNYRREVQIIRDEITLDMYQRLLLLLGAIRRHHGCGEHGGGAEAALKIAPYGCALRGRIKIALSHVGRRIPLLECSISSQRSTSGLMCGTSVMR